MYTLTNYFLGVALQKVEVSGFDYGLGSALSLKLAVNGIEMFLYGTDRDDQILRNLLI